MLKVENIEKDGRILAIVLRSSKPDSVVEFITPAEFSLQLGVHIRKEGDYVKAHEHTEFDNPKKSSVQDILIVKKGKISVGLYYQDRLFRDVILSQEDAIIISTGHNVKFLEDTEMIEIKQGPYRGKEVEKKFLE
jgi:hypothetical protein